MLQTRSRVADKRCDAVACTFATALRLGVDGETQFLTAEDVAVPHPKQLMNHLRDNGQVLNFTPSGY